MGSEVKAPLRTQDILYKPSAWGDTFHRLKCREALGAGAAGPGKTTVLLHDVLDQLKVEHERCMDRSLVDWHPWGSSVGWALHLRRTVKMLEQTIVKSHKLFPIIDPGAKFDAQKTTWTFSSGYHYQFGHCKDSDSWEDYMSFEFTALYFDELVQFEQQQYQNIMGRLRTSDPVLVKMLKGRAMSNPMMRHEGENFSFRGDMQWVRKYYVDPAPDGRRYLVTRIEHPDGEIDFHKRIYLPARLEDNPDPVFVRNTRAGLLRLPRFQQEALIYGNWYITAGSYFGDVWKRQLHVVDAFEIPKEWPMFRSMDWGFKAHGCVHWYAMDPDGNLYVVRELPFQKKFDWEVADMIKAVEIELGCWKNKRSLLRGPADTQLWEERGDSGKSKAKVMTEKGVIWNKAVKGKGSRRNNAQRLAKRLDDHHEGTTTPGIVFFRNCEWAIRVIPSVQTQQDDPETPLDGGEDHPFDSILYGVNYASHGRANIGLTVEELEEDEEKEELPTGTRGQYGYG